MIYKLKKLFLFFVIKLFHKMEKLTKKEQLVQKNYLTKLRIVPRKTKKPVVVAMVGLVGSGKTSVAKEIAPVLGGTIIVADKIRSALRQVNEKFENTRAIAENVAVAIIKQAGNPIFDADFIDQEKRVSLKEKIKNSKAKLIFVRVYCDRDIMMGRIAFKPEEKFFKDAKSKWAGSNKGQVIKLREMWRRTPRHYQWDAKGGGNWILKKLPFKVVEIDTSADNKWPLKIRKELAELI